ncbi:hypothetical protein HN51_028509 [Arachis hypogaea]
MPQNVMVVDIARLLLRGLENNGEDDSPAAKKFKSEKFPLNNCEFAAALVVFFLFATGLFYIYLTMPASEFAASNSHAPFSNLRLLKHFLFPPYDNSDRVPENRILGCSTQDETIEEEATGLEFRKERKLSSSLSVRKLSIVEEMGNNNTTDIKEEDNVREAEKKTHNDLNHHEDSVKEENEVNPTSKREYADSKSAKEFYVHSTSEPAKDEPQEDKLTDDLKVEMQAVPTAEGKDVEEKVTLPSMSKNDSFQEGTNAGNAHMENRMIPTSESEEFQEKNAPSDHTGGEGDTNAGDVHTRNQMHPTAEGTDVQGIDTMLALDHSEASDPKEHVSQGLDTYHASNKDETEFVLCDSRIDVLAKSTIVDSEDQFDLTNSNNSAGQEILEVGLPDRTENAESVEEGGEKCEILSSFSLVDTEDYGNQTESTLREDLLLTNLDHLEEDPKQEEENTKVLISAAEDMFSEAELQESPVADQVLPESSLIKGDFLDTTLIRPEDNDVVIERDTQTQENNVSSNISGDNDRDEVKNSLGDLSGIKSNSPSGNISNGTNLLTKVNGEHSSMHEFEENHKLLHAESTTENSHEKSPIGPNGDSNGERNEEPTCNGHHFDDCDDNNPNKKDSDEAEKGLEVLEQCNSQLVTIDHVESFSLHNSSSLLHIYSFQEGTENHTKNHNASSMSSSDYEDATSVNDKNRNNNASEDQNHHLVIAEAEVIPLVSHVESFSLQNSNSLSHVYSYQEISEKLNSSIDDKAFDNECEDCTDPCPNNSTLETRESTSTTTTVDSCSCQIQKSPSFNLNLQIGESEQSPLLYEDKCSTSEMPVEEEKIVTMERSYSEKSKYSKQGNIAGTCETVEKEVTPTMPKSKEKRKAVSSFFINCMCCATVAN